MSLEKGMHLQRLEERLEGVEYVINEAWLINDIGKMNDGRDKLLKIIEELKEIVDEDQNRVRV